MFFLELPAPVRTPTLIHLIFYNLEQKESTFLIFTVTSAVQVSMPAATAVRNRGLTITEDFTNALIESNTKAFA